MAKTLSEILTLAIERAAPGILRVEGRRGYPLSGVAWSEEVVVTSRRAVEWETGIGVAGEGDGRWAATFAGEDPRSDLAVLRVEGGGLSPAARAGTADARVGQVVLMAGRPGRGVRASLGIVSQWPGEGGGWAGFSEPLLHSDAQQFPGYSGGPLLNEAGEAMAMNSSAFSHLGNAALPLERVGRVVGEILEHGRVRSGYLGITGQRVRLPDEVQRELGQRTGVLVTQVEPGAPAAAGGLALGDTLTAMGGAPVRFPAELAARLDASLIGRELPVRALRGGRLEEFTVVVGERP